MPSQFHKEIRGKNKMGNKERFVQPRLIPSGLAALATN